MEKSNFFEHITMHYYYLKLFVKCNIILFADRLFDPTVKTLVLATNNIQLLQSQIGNEKKSNFFDGTFASVLDHVIIG